MNISGNSVQLAIDKVFIEKRSFSVWQNKQNMAKSQ